MALFVSWVWFKAKSAQIPLISPNAKVLVEYLLSDLCLRILFRLEQEATVDANVGANVYEDVVTTVAKLVASLFFAILLSLLVH